MPKQDLTQSFVKKIEIENYIVLSDQKLKEINLHIDLNEKISNQVLNIFFKDLFCF